MDEDHGFEPGQDEIGRTRQVPGVQTEPVTEAVDDRPDLELRPGVRPADPGHDLGSLGCGENVGHEEGFVVSTGGASMSLSSLIAGRFAGARKTT